MTQCAGASGAGQPWSGSPTNTCERLRVRLLTSDCALGQPLERHCLLDQHDAAWRMHRNPHRHGRHQVLQLQAMRCGAPSRSARHVLRSPN